MGYRLRMQPFVLITGAGSGIGLATTLEVARRGRRPLAAVHLEEQRDTVSKAAAEAGVEVETTVLDVADEDACADVVAGRELLEALVNVAGYVNAGAIVDVDDAAVRRHLEVMLVAPMRLARLALPSLRDNGPGRIVNIGSVLGQLSTPLMGWYDGGKHALEAVNDALRLELVREGVQVVLIEPGAIRTPIWDKAREDMERHEGLRLRRLVSPVGSAHPHARPAVQLPRGGRPDGGDGPRRRATPPALLRRSRNPGRSVALPPRPAGAARPRAAPGPSPLSPAALRSRDGGALRPIGGYREAMDDTADLPVEGPRWRGINHLALVTNDMDATVRFYHGVLGARLVADHRHARLPPLLLRVRPGEHGGVLRVRRAPSSSRSPSRRASPTRRPIQFDHLSFNLPDEEALLALRDRLKSDDCEVTDVVDHGFIRSIYFTDPNGIALEASWWVVDATGRARRLRRRAAVRRPRPGAGGRRAATRRPARVDAVDQARLTRHSGP